VQKLLVKCWVNWPPGRIIFADILRADFSCPDPKSAERHWWLDWIFTLLGSTDVKASRKHVGEIDYRWLLSRANRPRACAHFCSYQQNFEGCKQFSNVKNVSFSVTSGHFLREKQLLLWLCYCMKFARVKT